MTRRAPKAREVEAEVEEAANSLDAIFIPDDWNPEDVGGLDEEEERELLAWLQLDEQKMWMESKDTRRKAIPTLLRRLAKARQGA